jgi:hypothetical protein
LPFPVVVPTFGAVAETDNEHQKEIAMFDQEIFDTEADVFEGDFEGDFESDFEGDFEGDFETEQEGEGDWELFDAGEGGGPFSSAEEMELAAELLTLSDEAELEQVLGKLIKKVGGKVKKFAKSSAGKALGGILKSAAKKALPIVGRAAGTFFGGPAGGAIGAKLASSAGRIFGLELEGMSPEDQEFEVARRFVRFAGTAAKKTALAPRSAPSMAIAKAAVKAAARQHAPGLLRSGVSAPAAVFPSTGRRSGRWIRRGRKIVVLGA